MQDETNPAGRGGRITGERPYYLIAQPIDEGGSIGYPLDVPRVVAAGDTPGECFADMADRLGPILHRCAAWDFVLGVGERARDIVTEYGLVEGPLVGQAITSEQLGTIPPGLGGARLARPPRARGAIGPCFLTAQTIDEDGDLSPYARARGDTLAECFAAMADEIGTVDWHAFDLTLDVGEPAWPEQWGLPTEGGDA